MEKSRKELIVRLRKKNVSYWHAINGPGAAVRKFRKSHPHLKFGESLARALRKKYVDQEKKGPNVDK